MRSLFRILALIGVMVLATSALAQGGPATGIAIAGEPGPFALQGKAGMMSMQFEGMDAKPVKGAPFCATIANEHSQQFADGNRIHTNGSSLLCRDSQGRIRRESELNLLGAVPDRTPGKLITIIDPVAGFRYVLESGEKIARKMPLLPEMGMRVIHEGPGDGAAPPLPPPGAETFHVETAGGPGTFNTFYIARKGKLADGPAPKEENLGDQTIDGIKATGTRVTTTIPAGQMGNELPILVTSERWYSADLKATVMTKHSDPWAGELKTQFTNVNTAEPDAALFTVPSDYKVVDDKPFTMRKHLAPVPKE